MTAVGRYSRRFFTSARHAGPGSDHFDGRKFNNQEPTERWAREVFRWLLSRRPEAWPPRERAAPRAASPLARVDDLRVTFVNHSTVLIQTAGVNLLTDPVWSARVGPFPWLGAVRVREPGIAFEELPKIDLILLSHDHYDHLDMATVRRLVARDRPRLFCGLGVERTLRIDGFADAEPCDWWQTRRLTDAVDVTFTPSKHFSGRGLYDQDSTLWGSFVVTTPLGPLYFAGDTGYGPHFAAVRARFGAVACALLPVGAYEPRWFMRTYHMAPDEAVKAHQDLGARLSVGIHHSTFRLGDESFERPALDLAKALRRAGLAAEDFLMLGFGASVDIPDDETWRCAGGGTSGKD